VIPPRPYRIPAHAIHRYHVKSLRRQLIPSPCYRGVKFSTCDIRRPIVSLSFPPQPRTTNPSFHQLFYITRK
jgi:hypothetical protein